MGVFISWFIIKNRSHQNQQMSINTNNAIDNMASINISLTINSQDNAQSNW